MTIDKQTDPLVAVARRTRSGDLWRMGPHLLLCGDSTDPDTVLRLMDGEVADLVVTDPPYGVSYVGKPTLRRPIANDSLTNERLRSLLIGAFASWPLKSGGSFYVCAPTGATQLEFRIALNDAGLQLRQSLAWVKHQFVISRSDYQNKHETILYGWKDGARHRFFGGRRQTTVWEHAKPHKSSWHPTAKPVALVSQAIENSSLPNEIIFDGFGGGGSVLIACEALGRKSCIIEIDPAYCDATMARWEEATGQSAVLIPSKPAFSRAPLKNSFAGERRRSRARSGEANP